MSDRVPHNSQAKKTQAHSTLNSPQQSTNIDVPTPFNILGGMSVNGNIPADKLLLLQRSIGNSATKRLIQRSHGQGCGCSTCSGGHTSAETQTNPSVQRQTADTDSHGTGCRCPSCASVQRTPNLIQTFRSPLTVQRLMAADVFKKKTKALGFRNLIKPIDKAVAAYAANNSKMSSEQKVAALQKIVVLCDSYLNAPSRKKSDRRSGVEALKNEAESEITQWQVITPEETQSVDTTPEVNQSVDTTLEENQSIDTTPEVNQSIEPSTTEVNQSVDTSTTTTTTTTTAPVEENQSVDTSGSDENMSIDPTLSDTQQMTPVTNVSETAIESGTQPKTPEATVDPEKTAATDYFNRLVKGEDIFAATPLKEGEKAKSRKDILDLLQAQLTATEFTQAASLIILNIPESVVEGEKARKAALSHLAILFKDKTVARNLLDKNAVVVVVPKNKKMTDLPQFSSLAGKKTFDGRDWDKVRGSGGMEINGHIYVAVTEENTLGTDGEGDVSGTQWCYDSGYSTTTHEIAHVIDMHGLTPEDRKKVDDLYKAKKDKQTNGEVVEWIDGFDYDKPGVKKDKAQEAFDEWNLALPGKLTTAGMADEEDRKQTIAWAKYLIVDGGAYADNTYTVWLEHVGMVDGDKVKKKDGTQLGGINATSKKVVFGGKQTCYASSHRLEYFAQSANAFFGTNMGTEPYTNTLWTAAGEADKGTRRNGKSEVTRIEPELKGIFDRIFGSQDINDANPRDKVKKDKEGTGG